MLCNSTHNPCRRFDTFCHNYIPLKIFIQYYQNNLNSWIYNKLKSMKITLFRWYCQRGWLRWRIHRLRHIRRGHDLTVVVGVFPQPARVRWSDHWRWQRHRHQAWCRRWHPSVGFRCRDRGRGRATSSWEEGEETSLCRLVSQFTNQFLFTSPITFLLQKKKTKAKC